MANKTWGEYAYLLGLIIAVVAGLAVAAGALGAATASWVALVLVILGVVVGLMNISEKEVHGFLLATVALLVAGAGADWTGSTGVFTALNVVPGLGTLLNAIVSNFAVFAAPAAIITAVKAVHGMARSK